MVGYATIVPNIQQVGQYGQALNIQGELLDDADKTHPPPLGFVLKGDVEESIWDSLMKSRSYREWTPAELLLACRVVKLETMIRRGMTRLDEMMDEGGDPFDPDSIVCDYNSKLLHSQRTQVAFMRALGFTRGNLIQSKNEQNRNMRERHMGDLLDSVGGALPSFLAAS